MTSKSFRQTLWFIALLALAACAGAQESATSAAEAGSTTTAPGPSTTLTTATPTTQPAASTSSTVQEVVEVSATGSQLEPGTYYVDPDGPNGTEMKVEFTITEPGWVGFLGTYKNGTSSDYVAMKAQIVTEVASPACNSTIFVPVGGTAEDLASALAEIEDFPSRGAPVQVTAYGYDGYHLTLEVPGEEIFGSCDDGYFDGYQGPTIGRYYQGPGQVVEFWVVDVEGTPLLIEATWFHDSPVEDVARLRTILDSIVIRP